MAGTAVLGLALTACGEGSDSEPNAKDKASSSESASADKFTNDKCAANQTSADTLRVGGILPLTGNLAFLGPPEIAGVGLAVSDINAAGGVKGAKACHDVQDSGDSTDMAVSTASAGTLVASKPSVVIGAASSSVSLNVVDTFADNKVVEVSPANTAVDLSGYSPWYFRTAPPDGVQGNALGTLITTDGYKGDGDEFPAGQTTFSAEVSGVLASKPDAIVVLAFDETKSIVPELKAQGWDMSKVYLTDGNTSDFSEDFAKGTLEGAQGTIPGADPDATFKDRVSGWAEVGEGKPLKDYSYAAESYDATILAALAAVKGGATDSQTIRDNYAAVSGATKGEECKSYEDCVKLLDDGKEIRYTGPSGIGPIDKQNDPSSAFVGIYKYDGENVNKLSSTVEGTK
jgi:neutral amino acid transport system substrate-binding protein